MRCVGCHADPLTPEHYCECCGRRLSLEESSPETALIAFETYQESSAASVVHCGSCGGPTAGGDGDICAACRQAFGSLLGGTTVTSAAGDSAGSDSTTPYTEVAPLEASPLSELISFISATPAPDAPDVAPPVEVQLPPPVVPEMAPASNHTSEIAKAEAARSDRDPSCESAESSAVVSKPPVILILLHRRSDAEWRCARM